MGTQIPYNRPDSETPDSFLYRVYALGALQQDSHVYFFDGAFGSQGIDRWDPTPVGYYGQDGVKCPFSPFQQLAPNPECNYDRVKQDLEANGFSEKQVQAILMKPAIGYPQCDILGGQTNGNQGHCDQNYSPPPGLPRVDAYQVSTYLGNIMRYLKRGLAPYTLVRYPNLHQVFLTSRIYGGYSRNANGSNGGEVAGCQSPEPFAFEEGFGVQRLIVAQIDRSTTGWAGAVRYPEDSPWVDWGPYLWASADNPRQTDGLFWCDTTSTTPQCTAQPLPDLRFGDLTQEDTFWGDHTHPTTQGGGKVADRILEFLGKTPQNRNPLTPWIDAH